MPLDPEVAEEMRRKAQQIKERQAGGNFTRAWSLTGKNAVVEAGRSIIIRLLPRWDYKDSMILQGDRRVPNPAYKPGQRIYVQAFEHWWDGPDGKRMRAWCPRTLDEQTHCPICLASLAMKESGSKEDKEFGKDIEAKEVYIFNAVVGNPARPWRLTDKGQADIRILPVQDTIYRQISDIMTGGDQPEFGRGDISDPSGKEGYDLKFSRPVAGGSDRWKVEPAPTPTPLYTQEQKEAFKGWPNMLIDLEKMLKDETKSPLELFRLFYGREPEGDELETGMTAAEGAQQTEWSDPAAPAPNPAPTGPDNDDEWLPPAADSKPATAPAAPRTSTKPATRSPMRGRR